MRKKKPPTLPPSDDDLWLDVLHTECARAVAHWLKAGVNLDRQIKTLTLPELRGCAAAVEARWLKLVSQRLANAGAPFSEAERENYLALLSG